MSLSLAPCPQHHTCWGPLLLLKELTGWYRATTHLHGHQGQLQRKREEAFSMIKAQRAELVAEPGAEPVGSGLIPTDPVAGLGAQQGSEPLSLPGSHCHVHSHGAAFSQQREASSEAALWKQC